MRSMKPCIEVEIVVRQRNADGRPAGKAGHCKVQLSGYRGAQARARVAEVIATYVRDNVKPTPQPTLELETNADGN